MKFQIKINSIFRLVLFYSIKLFKTFTMCLSFLSFSFHLKNYSINFISIYVIILNRIFSNNIPFQSIVLDNYLY
ncbi:unnamed protein product [Rotaria socialis]|uniref:Uncharacterized protein n=2 Tax=Rotaria socialis TaxID=392032 RepID=A0A819B8Z3_9BILA|nr:unnamed protein product [Rotaria socialis]CAF3797643.1 unnamed protein product [Rotaria socialis]